MDATATLTFPTLPALARALDEPVPSVGVGIYWGLAALRVLGTMPDPVIVGSDHAGFALKLKVEAELDRLGVPWEDVGTSSEESVDYPDFAHRVAEAVASGRFSRGVVLCGTGIGVSIAANRHRGVRAAVAYDEATARLSREHNDANVLALGGRSLDHALALRILKIWLETSFTGGRHARRVEKIETR